MIDVNKPENREAMKWACERSRDPKAAAHLLTVGDAGTREQRDAMRALSSPSDSAAIVRALLEGCGVRVVEHGKNKGTMADFLYVSVVDHEDEPESPLYVSMALEQVPQKVLQLLAVLYPPTSGFPSAATRAETACFEALKPLCASRDAAKKREKALAALKEHAR